MTNYEIDQQLQILYDVFIVLKTILHFLRQGLVTELLPFLKSRQYEIELFV